MKILVIQQKMIGDVLTSSLICENLKRNFPNAEVHYLINRFTLPVVENHPYIDDFVIFEDEYRQSKLKFYRFLKQISKSNYTHVFDAYSKLESLLITIFSKASHKYGFAKFYTNTFYNSTIKFKKKSKTEAGTAIEDRLRLFKLLPHVKVFNYKPKIFLSDDEDRLAQQKICDAKLSSKKIVMISALGSNASKTYPLRYMAEILNNITRSTNAHLILNYMPNQQSEINKLLKYCDIKTKKLIVKNIEMNSLRDFMAVCKACKAIVGNEGGAINIAKALDIPSFSIFSPWIIKEGWNSFEVSYPNTSVHISDFENDWFDKHKIENLKKNAKLYYKLLNPKLFKNKLIDFLNSYVASDQIQF